MSHAVGTDVDPFLADLQHLANRTPTRCIVGKWVGSLPDAHATALAKMLEDTEHVKTIDLHRFMQRHGFTGHRTVIGTHRNNGCSCVR
ncbi:MAG: hypothetical protein M0Z51_17035 [Propionibacterium sp.]|nr:hypothetical protein [Propionibacterium sp.]